MGPVPSTAPERRTIGGIPMDTVSYSVDAALAAEGGDAIAGMLEALGIVPADVELTIAVGPDADPTVSDWRLPGADAASVLDAWQAEAPGEWSSDQLGGVPALVGRGVDGATGWALATDGRFVYVRTEDRSLAEQIATTLEP